MSEKVTAEQPVDGAELLVRQLKAGGVQNFFSLIEPSLNTVFRSIYQHGLKLVHPRHEAANVHMADASYRTSGQIAVAMGTMGPGFANMVSGAITADLEGMPVLIIATQRIHKADRAVRRGRFQWCPQLDIMKPICKYSAIVQDPATLPEYAREAIRAAMSGRPGPVFLEISTNVLEEVVEDAENIAIIDTDRYLFAPGIPDPNRIEEAAELLANAKLPLIVAGTGSWRSKGGVEQLKALAERTGAMVINTFGARGAFPEDHPNSVPLVVKENGCKATHGADVVLAVGTPMSESIGYGRPPAWPEPKDQKFIHLDVDPTAHGSNRETDVALLGDAAAGMKALNEAIARRAEPKQLSEYGKECVAELVAERSGFLELGNSDAVPIHPVRLAKEAEDFFGHDSIASIDGGSTQLWNLSIRTCKRPGNLMWTSHFGHLGTGLPFAVGAKTANPDKTVYVYTGDGAMGFNLTELETCVREGLDIVIVVASDYAWGLEDLPSGMFLTPALGCNPGYLMSKTQRFDKVVEGFGGHGEFVTEPSEIRPALERAKAAGKVAVVQVEIDTKANGFPANLLNFGSIYSASAL